MLYMCWDLVWGHVSIGMFDNHHVYMYMIFVVIVCFMYAMSEIIFWCWCWQFEQAIECFATSLRINSLQVRNSSVLQSSLHLSSPCGLCPQCVCYIHVNVMFSWMKAVFCPPKCNVLMNEGCDNVSCSRLCQLDTARSRSGTEWCIVDMTTTWWEWRQVAPGCLSLTHFSRAFITCKVWQSCSSFTLFFNNSFFFHSVFQQFILKAGNRRWCFQAFVLVGCGCCFGYDF